MHDILLALPFALAIGLALGLVGGGGSILAVPVLVYVLGEPVKQATTASLAIVGTTALVGAADHVRAGGVRFRVAIAFGAAGAVGAFAGTALNRLVSGHAILIAFGLVMLAAAYALLRRRGRGSDRDELSGSALAYRVVPAGLATGVLTGFFGVGGGFIVVPVLVLLLGLPMVVAVGTSLLVIAITSASALVAHLVSGSVNWTVVAVFTAGAIGGELAGSRLGNRLSSARLTQMFAVVIVGVAVFLIVKNVAATL